MKQIIVVLLIATLCSCGTTQSESSIKVTNSKWVGLTLDELIVSNGEPSDSYSADGGGRVFEYLVPKEKTAAAQYLTPKTFRTIEHRQDTTQLTLPSDLMAQSPEKSMEQAEANAAAFGEGIAWRKRGTRKTSDSEQDNFCKILFNISASDIVESLTIEGKGCN